jgi:lipoate---protein ligase
MKFCDQLPSNRHRARTRVLVSDSHNPWFNLATEEWIFNSTGSDEQILFLWRNFDSVVIGRNQNPWIECNLPQMECDNVALVRRTSGGGAVFHDLGNANHTFISPRSTYDRKANQEILLKALARLGIAAEASCRHDIMIPTAEGLRKVSGSAFRETKNRAFHHGTLLVNSDLNRLWNYLTAKQKKIESKGRPSVRSPVMNLRELSPTLDQVDWQASWNEVLIAEFQSYYGEKCEVERLDPNHLEALPELKATYEKLTSWQWTYGHTPPFTHELRESFPWGEFAIRVGSQAGRFESVELLSSDEGHQFVGDFSQALCGKTYCRNGVSEALLEVQNRFPHRLAEMNSLATWLARQF